MKNRKDTNVDAKKGEIVIYKAKSGSIRLDVKLEKETVWLTQKQLAKLFLTERSVITKHLNNIFQTGELDEKSNVQKMHIAFSNKPVKLYNLDVIVSVGYRVNSKRATQFRIWATRILKDYLVKGYALNQKRLLDRETALTDLKDTIAFISGKAVHPQLAGKGDELLKLLNEYANALTMITLFRMGIKGLRRFFLSTILRRMAIYAKSMANARLMIMQSSLFLCLLPQAIRVRRM